MSNKGLNSNEALEESTATNSSVTLSGIRREKEVPTDLDIENYRLDPGNSDPQESRFAQSQRYHAFFAVFFLIYNLAMLDSNLLRLM